MGSDRCNIEKRPAIGTASFRIRTKARVLPKPAAILRRIVLAGCAISGRDTMAITGPTVVAH